MSSPLITMHHPGLLGPGWFSYRLLICLWCICLLAACGDYGPQPQRTDPVQEIVSAQVPGDVQTVYAKLRLFLNDGATFDESAQRRFTGQDWLSIFQAVPVSAPAGAQQVEAPNDVSLKASANNNPALQRYIQLQPDERKYSLYLFRIGGPYNWPSEYTLNGRALPFATDFIIYLKPLNLEKTYVEIIEVFPYVIAGEKWGVQPHAIMYSRVIDKRDVPPTTRDRIRLLNRLVEAISDTEPQQGNLG